MEILSHIKKSSKFHLGIHICIFLTAIMLIFARELKESVIKGMNLAVIQIIPTVFPFMILSDLWISCIEINRKSKIALCFENLIGINNTALISLLSGIFCGFPLGVKTAVSLYESGVISRNELERISPVANLPSLAFVISGVGLGLLGDAKIGIILYISVLAASIVLAAIEKPKEKIKQNTGVIFKQNFNLMVSIQKAGTSSLIMAAYISFFSAVIGILDAILKSSLLTAILSTIFEVGSSTNLIATEASFSHTMRLSLIAFSLGFSGMSVHFQAFTFLPGEVSRTKYLIRKLIIGIISSLIFSAIFHLYKKSGCF